MQFLNDIWEEADKMCSALERKEKAANIKHKIIGILHILFPIIVLLSNGLYNRLRLWSSRTYDSLLFIVVTCLVDILLSVLIFSAIYNCIHIKERIKLVYIVGSLALSISSLIYIFFHKINLVFSVTWTYEMLMTFINVALLVHYMINKKK